MGIIIEEDSTGCLLDIFKLGLLVEEGKLAIVTDIWNS